MWAVTASQLAYLRSSFSYTVRVDIATATGTYRGSVDIVGGEVTSSTGSQQVRGARIEVDSSYIDAGLFNQYTDVVYVNAVFGDNYFTVPLFAGRVESVNANESGSVVVQCVDRAADVIRAKFEQPWSITQGSSFVVEMTKIVQNAGQGFALDSSAIAVPKHVVDTAQLTYDTEPGQALDELAVAAGAIWMATRSGAFVVLPDPYAQLAEPPTVLTLDDTNGDLSTLQSESSRTDIRNSVTVIVERAGDQQDPIRVTVRDTNPNSPTLWGPLFGRQNEVRKLNTAVDPTSAVAYAQRLLRQLTAPVRTWRISTPLSAVLDPYDVIAVRYRNEVTCQVIESISCPLDSNTAEISTRAWRPVASDAVVVMSS